MSLKIYAFACEAGHVFEGWLAQDADWAEEAREGRLSCPVCGSTKIEKRPTAPNFSRIEGTTRTEVESDLQGRVMKAMRRVISRAEDVGERFPEEARAMALGSSKKEAVIGKCSPEEAEELLSEGISILPVPSFLSKVSN